MAQQTFDMRRSESLRSATATFHWKEVERWIMLTESLLLAPAGFSASTRHNINCATLQLDVNRPAI